MYFVLHFPKKRKVCGLAVGEFASYMLHKYSAGFIGAEVMLSAWMPTHVCFLNRSTSREAHGCQVKVQWDWQIPDVQLRPHMSSCNNESFSSVGGIEGGGVYIALHNPSTAAA